MSDILGKIEKGLKELFPGIGDTKITGDTQLGQVPDWDSMSAVNFQSFLEQNFQISVPIDLLGEEMSINDVISYMRENQTMKAA